MSPSSLLRPAKKGPLPLQYLIINLDSMRLTWCSGLRWIHKALEAAVTFKVRIHKMIRELVEEDEPP